MRRIHAAGGLRRLLAALALLGLLAGCGPEVGRQRGEPGADVGNRPADFEPRSKIFSTKSPE